MVRDQQEVSRIMQELLCYTIETQTDQNLALLPDYNRRVEVLEKLEYINQEVTVELKGRVACEINSANKLVLTELIFENAFADYDYSEIVALLSCFIFQERIVEEPKLISTVFFPFGCSDSGFVENRA
ncbi:hypothetical protein C2G38_2047181 [Gigaspora rosea]|uniref:ATP-dependent RNA helicase Ski2/MTR4 C-terminal domain-containing protein n=1 Tax=Gigaspora rosea TaxID=44941 RepID=A0A397U6V6_9GLOM|nr:hypothetical protein C2G38_2047181 [Gigaspora rosea]